jgi:hypothetical protein
MNNRFIVRSFLDATHVIDFHEEQLCLSHFYFEICVCYMRWKLNQPPNGNIINNGQSIALFNIYHSLISPNVKNALAAVFYSDPLRTAS